VGPVVVKLLETPSAFGRAWNLGGAGVTTQLDLARMAYGDRPPLMVAGKTMLRLFGLFDPSLSSCRTRRGGETRSPSRYARGARGRATDTYPRAHPARARRPNRCPTFLNGDPLTSLQPLGIAPCRFSLGICREWRPQYADMR
jgi:hypothetical protein